MTGKKINKLKTLLKEMKSVVIAFSGGVDSTFLLNIAKNEPGVKVIAATARFPAFPESELKDSKKIAKNLGCRHIVINFNQLGINKLKNNPKNRCYYCKKNLLIELIRIKNKFNFDYVIDGTNSDDLNTFRPGIKALRELGVKSPLADAGMTGEEIRSVSKQLKLPTWNKPSFSCLLSRLPYGATVSESILNKIKKAEIFLRAAGFKQVRVRYHCPVARIEVNREELPMMIDSNIRAKVVRKLKNTGFKYICLDLEGYRPGSMDEFLL